jgi:hypothetical protein
MQRILCMAIDPARGLPPEPESEKSSSTFRDFFSPGAGVTPAEGSVKPTAFHIESDSFFDRLTHAAELLVDWNRFYISAPGGIAWKLARSICSTR